MKLFFDYQRGLWLPTRLRRPEPAKWMPAGPCPHFSESLALPPPPLPRSPPLYHCWSGGDRPGDEEWGREPPVSHTWSKNRNSMLENVSTVTYIDSRSLSPRDDWPDYPSVLLLTNHAYLNRPSSPPPFVSYSCWKLNAASLASPRLCQRLNYYVILHFEWARWTRRYERATRERLHM